MYNKLQDLYAKQAGQAVSLQSNCGISANNTGPAPEQMPMSAMAADLVNGLMELNGSLRLLRTQLFGQEPEGNSVDQQSVPSSLGQAICFAGMEMREAHSQVQRILGRL